MVGSEPVSVHYERSWRARHYRLTLRRDGAAVVTIPPRGSEAGAQKFLEEHRDWLDRARARQRRRPRAPDVWQIGTLVLWRGEPTPIRQASIDAPDPWGAPPAAKVCLAADVFIVSDLKADLRPGLEAQFLLLAKVELPGRAWELAAQTGLGLRRISVRNQRSRWGSCSPNGTVCLNWRLIQTPDFVRDYIIYHELAHLRELNHSDRFWAQVAALCPGWREAERWLKGHGSLVGL